MGMNRNRANLQAYLAGIIDGEGSFGIYWINGSWSSRLSVNMQDPEAVLMLKRLYPDGTFAKYTKAGKEVYYITYSNNRVYDITLDLLPYLIVKHQQAKIVLSYLVHKRRDPGRHGNCNTCESFANKLVTQRNSAKGVNSVNALLDHEMREYRAKREDVEQDVTYMLGLLEGVETKDRVPQPVEPTSAPEQEIVHTT